MLSMASMIRNSAESVPTVMSVPQKSLSIEPTIPTMFRLAHCSALSADTVPAGHQPHTSTTFIYKTLHLSQWMQSESSTSESMSES